MEFLKAILGDELYQQVADKIALYNGTPENKEKQIKLANLGEGGYVSKDKYAALEATHTSKLAELEQANTLIADLQKAEKSNEALQAKVTAYETQVQQLQEQATADKKKMALKVALIEEGVEDTDYVTFKLEQKLKEEGKTLELDDNDKIKGWDAYRDSLKVQFPNQFNSAKDREINPLKLDKGDPRKTTVTREEFAKMGYEERVALKKENEELYKQLKNN